MRICFIGHNIHFLSSASGSAVLPRETIKCVYKNTEISLITTEDYDTLNRRLYEEPLKEFQPILRRFNSVHRVIRKSSLPLYSITSYSELSKFVKSLHVDILHLFELYPLSLPLIYKLAHRIGAKVIYHAYMPVNNIIGKVRTFFLKRFTDGIIVSSPHVLRSFVDLKRVKLMRIIPPPIDTNVYRPTGHVASNEHVMLYIGPLDTRRFPINLMIKLVKHLQHNIPELKLTVVVAPRFRDDLLKLNLLLRMAFREGIERNLQIIYTRLSTEEKVSLYSNADIILFPFSKSYKGAVDPPLTLLEAMACGGLIVATNVLSIPWIIRNRYNGFICPDHAQMFSTIKEVLMLTDMRKSLIRNRAVETIQKRFSSAVIRNQILSFYNKVITAR